MPFLTTPFRRKTPAETAAEEARRRWEILRAQAAERTEDLLDAAGDQLEHAREVTAPRVRDARERAVKAATPVAERLREQAVDTSARLRQEATEASARASRELARIVTDVRDASRVEADRIIQAIHDQAEEARAEERKRRARAVLGFTVFGMLAGALLYRELDQRRAAQSDQDQGHEQAEALPVTASPMTPPAVDADPDAVAADGDAARDRGALQP
jgi:signal transduction histidine kinase